MVINLFHNRKNQKKANELFYLIPMGLYIFIPILLSQLNIDPSIGYVLRTTIVGAILLLFLPYYKEIKLKTSILAVIIGIIIFLLWILTSQFGNISSSIPTIPLAYKTQMLIIRFIGAILVAPLVEELFIRSYLMRVLISKNWQSVPIGKADKTSFLVTTLFFGFAHQQIVAGIIVGIILTFLLYYKKNITNCIIAHAVANLILFIYVIITGSYYFW